MTTLNSTDTAQNFDQSSNGNGNGTATDLGGDGNYVEVASLTLSTDDISVDSDTHQAAGAASTNGSSRISLPASRLSTALPKSSGRRAFDIANRMAAAKTLENLYQITVTALRKRLQSDRAFIYRFQSSAAGTVIAESVTAGYTPMLGEQLGVIAFGANSEQDYQIGRAHV